MRLPIALAAFAAMVVRIAANPLTANIEARCTLLLG